MILRRLKNDLPAVGTRLKSNRNPLLPGACFSGLIACALLFTGCSNNQKPIVFLSAAKVPAFARNNTASSIKSQNTHGLSKVDEQKIEMDVFSYLLKHKQWDNGDYSAIFLQASDNVVQGLIQKFPNHQPPIKQSSHLDLHSAKMPLDRDTGMPVMILGTEIGKPKANGTVDVIGRWYAGSVAKGDYTFTLKKTRGAWKIVSVK